MRFFPVLRDYNEQVFLIHAHLSAFEITAAILVIDGCLGDEWLTVSTEPCLEGERLEIRLPVELHGQHQRLKTYNAVLTTRPT